MHKGFKNTSWQRVAPWYNKITHEGSGHYFHEHVIIPEVLRLFELNSESKVLDLACGNGVLAKNLPKEITYFGADLSESLIKFAKSQDRNKNHSYIVSDITKPFTPEIDNNFTHAAIILALQNVQNPQRALLNASKHLVQNGKLIIVLNHPAFRIPRQTSWGIDEQRKMQYRRVDKYLSPMQIPINMNPSDRNSESTMSYHFPISDYSKMLKNSGFVIENIEEWTSDKNSVGKASKMENRARVEIPLFMTFVARKI